jgi:hypothetical protein
MSTVFLYNEIDQINSIGLSQKMRFRNSSIRLFLLLLLPTLLSACSIFQPTPTPTLTREELIPVGAVKMSPQNDENPPQLFSSDFESPVPVPGLVNTAGAEDGVFVTPDGNTMYFFFTPDVNVPVEQQLLDGVTGLYVSRKLHGTWAAPQRILLQDPEKLALDGCEFVEGNLMWFCSAREGYTGLHWFTAEYRGGSWQNWRNADFPPDYQVGELHISRDGKTMYFHSNRPGGKGGLDIWTSSLQDGAWQEPVNLELVNTPEDEGWPALNPAEDELWITRNWGVWRSKLVNGVWQPAELVISPLAGEASLDSDGNLYFVHHYYVEGQMIEADIYVAYQKKR